MPVALLLLGPFVAFFATGYFSGFGAVTAELYPTAIRATAQGFTYNIGRVASAAAPFAVGTLAQTRGFSAALSICSVAFVLAAVFWIWIPETRGRESDMKALHHTLAVGDPQTPEPLARRVPRVAAGRRLALAAASVAERTGSRVVPLSGPNGAGVDDTAPLPGEVGPGRNVVWKTPLPPGHSSPVLVKERVFVSGGGERSPADPRTRSRDRTNPLAPRTRSAVSPSGR